MLQNCHGHNLSKGNIIKIFYHGLSEITQEVLNSVAGGIFLYKTPNQAYQLLKDKVLLKLEWAKNQKTKSSLKKTVAFVHEGSSNFDTNKIMARIDAIAIKMDAQYKELQSRTKQSTHDLDNDDMPMSREEEAKFMQTFRKNHQASIQNLETKFDRLADKQSGRPSGSFPSNTQPNPRGDKAYQPPQACNEHVNVVFTKSGKSYDPPDNTNDQQKETLINFDSDDEDNEPTPQPKTQPTKSVKETPLPKPYKPKIPYPQPGMPYYGKFLKELIRNKHRIEQISTAFLSDGYLAIIQNEVPPKLRDPESFLILCNFKKTFSSNALADLVIRVKQKQLNLGVGTKRMIFNIDYATKQSYSNDYTYFCIDEILEEDFDALLDEGSKILHSIEGTLLEEEIFAEFDEFVAMTADENFDFESDTEEPPLEKITINTDYKIRTSLE
nr:hypothetical protein [Tanacetum cinerariifolium]